MLIGPARHLSCHLSARRYAAIHPKRPEGAEKRAVEQGTPPGIQNAGCTAGHGNHVPEANVFLVRNSTVFPRTSGNLRLHPQGTGLRLGVPERFSARSRTDKINCVKLLPRLSAFAGSYPGEAPDIDLGSRTPFVIRRTRQSFQRSSHTMRCDLAFGIQLSEQVRAPLQETELIIVAELQPVERLGVAAEAVRRMNVIPRGIAVSVPG